MEDRGATGGGRTTRWRGDARRCKHLLALHSASKEACNSENDTEVDTHAFEGIVARVLHVARARVVDLDHFALRSGRGYKERVHAGRRRRIVFGR